MNRNEQTAAATDRRHKPKNVLQRDTFAAENVAMPNPPTFHSKNQTSRDITHVDEVHNEIKVQIMASAEKVSKHRRRWCYVVIKRTDRHCGTSDYHRKT